MATGRSSSWIDREATTEIGFCFTALVLRRALKALFTMKLRRSNNMLRISQLALFCAISPSGRSHRRWKRAAHAKLDHSDCRNDPRI
jgi:hypothetical protein